MSDILISSVTLDVETFFKSPILTLLESLEDVDADHISNHDVLEAYATLSNQIKITAHLLTVATQEYPALSFLSKYTDPVIRCLRRDVKRALVDPSPRSSTHSGPIPQSIDFVANESSANMRKQVTEHPEICHAALGIVSNIFKFAALSALFSGKCIFPIMMCMF